MATTGGRKGNVEEIALKLTEIVTKLSTCIERELMTKFATD